MRSSKKHLYAAVKDQVLNLVEYANIFRRIEAILNSRPLCYQSDAQEGTKIITPAHFLIGRSSFALPPIDFNDSSLSNRLRLLQNQVKGYWRVWSLDYLNQMQQRVRWAKRETNLSVGLDVFVKDKASKPFQWPLGRIDQVYPDTNGDVRVVDLGFRGKVKRRSISSTVPLPIEEEFLNK